MNPSQDTVNKCWLRARGRESTWETSFDISPGLSIIIIIRKKSANHHNHQQGKITSVLFLVIVTFKNRQRPTFDTTPSKIRLDFFGVYSSRRFWRSPLPISITGGWWDWRCWQTISTNWHWWLVVRFTWAVSWWTWLGGWWLAMLTINDWLMLTINHWRC